MRVSIIIPVVRPEKAMRCVEAIQRLASEELYGDADYPFWGNTLEILAEQDADHIGCPRMVAKLTAMAQGEMVMFLGDDTIPQPGFLREALAAMEALPDGWGLVALNDGIHNGRLATHWLAHKKLLEHTGGEFFHTGYSHCFCDRELTDIAQSLGRYVYAEKAVIVHDHPHRTREEYDEHYKRAYAKEVFEADKRLYLRRKIARNGFKLAIAFPLVDKDVPAQFAISMLAMDKPDDWTLLVPRFPAGKFHDSIASVRNDIVEQALEHGCSHLLMADTDQVYPCDTLSRLLSHDKPIVGVAVHRRYPPFERIMMRGELGAFTPVPKEEAYSGELVEVDATGTGCVLFDMNVFLDVPYPWFEFTTFNGRTVGEDFNFCVKARNRGIPVHVDTGIEVDHLTTFRVNTGIAKLFQKFNCGVDDAGKRQ